MSGAAFGAGASALFQDLILDAAAGIQRGSKAEQDSRPDGDREGKQQGAEIDSGGDYARQRGIIIADTKFEFGQTGQGITLADEVLTPDSSRFWPADKYQPGKAQESYDKQYVRDYLEEIRWNKLPPAPALPQEVARRTSEKYLEAYRQLTGRELEI